MERLKSSSPILVLRPTFTLGIQSVTAAPASGASGHCLPQHSGSVWGPTLVFMLPSTASSQFEDSSQDSNSERNLQGLVDVAALRLLSLGPQLSPRPGKESSDTSELPRGKAQERAQRGETGRPRMTGSCNDHSLPGGTSPFHRG